MKNSAQWMRTAPPATFRIPLASTTAASRQAMRASDASDDGFHLCRIESGGEVAAEAEEDRAVGGMADAGEGERAVEIDLDAMDALEQPFARKIVGESESCCHRPHGVGTGRAYADFVEVEEAGHGRQVIRRRL